jgi:hypothetical protein
VRKSIAKLDLQINTEKTAMERLMRLRDLAINATNNANFFQINLLGIISNGPLSLTKDEKLVLQGNRLNVKSGYLVGILAGATALERPGLIRLAKTEPNELASAFSLNPPDKYALPSSVLKFLNTAPPDASAGTGTRLERLVDYWKTSHTVTCNVKKKSTLERMAAYGPGHHFWSERISVISNRVRMLYDLRAVIDLMNVGLSELVREMDQ